MRLEAMEGLLALAMVAMGVRRWAKTLTPLAEVGYQLPRTFQQSISSIGWHSMDAGHTVGAAQCCLRLEAVLCLLPDCDSRLMAHSACTPHISFHLSTSPAPCRWLSDRLNNQRSKQRWLHYHTIWDWWGCDQLRWATWGSRNTLSHIAAFLACA